MIVEKKYKIADLLSVTTLLISVLGVILVACHILIAGLVISSIGLICSIITRIYEKKLSLNERLAYWAEMLGIVLFIVCCFGFAGYTVWDIVNSKDVG